MAGRSLTTTLALAFAGTTIAVFALVGSVLYFALEKQVTQQDDDEIVLAARHTRRLANELRSADDVRAHADRLISQVLGNATLSMAVRDTNNQMLLSHNIDGGATSMIEPLVATQRVPQSARITETAIAEARRDSRVPVRGLAADASLADGSTVTIVIARDMSDRWLLLDHYRDRLYGAGFAGMLLAFLMSWMLVHESLRPLRQLAAHAAQVTVDRLHERMKIDNAPRELAAVIASLNAMLERLAGGFQRMSQYTADLAHDMRTPLANLRGSNEVALARPRSAEDYQAVLESNLEECERLSRMIESVLFLARAEHPQFATHMKTVDTHEELKRVADYFEGLADDAGVQVHVTGAGEVRADPELFRRAVSNLLANAIRHTPRGREIRLSAEPGAHAVRVTVANQGSRIDPSALERVFDRFYRADPARHHAPAGPASTGLGLAIVRTIMELHGGSAYAESDEASTRFILRFPKT
ncbi:heavy metal sensor histidine kinase [Paraburkholderia rhizosphaerae]|uniref:Sensor protein n=1 Tax=Paraburkholderia rhizosphaerae TaxID=480658 RepID=A0A4R8LUS7_9BURK|nr:heavy metal sensor histidine kinase [Paraburkholderia rhizosphaerae]TDY51529.1 heavy metal sensor signal transduction histidine kinase [Paraburkholderia rhizosphaerae]